MFEFPPSTIVNRVIPKTRIVENSRPATRLKDLLTQQIQQIRWHAKLSPETIHIPATAQVPEIQIFHITLKEGEIHPALLDRIDNTIPQPIIHQLENIDGHTALSAAHKRPSGADHGRWVTGERFTTGFTALSPPAPLPAAIDLGQLYTALIAAILPLARRPGESIADLTQRCHQHCQLQRQISQLQSKIRREKQFNRKVALNQELQQQQRQLTRLQLP